MIFDWIPQCPDHYSLVNDSRINTQAMAKPANSQNSPWLTSFLEVLIPIQTEMKHKFLYYRFFFELVLILTKNIFYLKIKSISQNLDSNILTIKPIITGKQYDDTHDNADDNITMIMLLELAL